MDLSLDHRERIEEGKKDFSSERDPSKGRTFASEKMGVYSVDRKVIDCLGEELGRVVENGRQKVRGNDQEVVRCL